MQVFPIQPVMHFSHSRRLFALLSFLFVVPSATAALTSLNGYVWVVFPSPVTAAGRVSMVYFIDENNQLNTFQRTVAPPPYIRDLPADFSSNRILNNIIDHFSLRSFPGAGLFIGYGSSFAEMIAANRYRAVFKATDVAEGHTVVSARDGTVFAWGANGHGQIGDGTGTDRSLPVRVTGLTDVTKAAVGDYHTAARKNNGTVSVWGNNEFGQVGDGTTTNRLAPVQVAGLTGVMTVVAGGGHTVALKNDGTVWAWGNNDSGQIGNETNINRVLTPVQVTGLTGVAAVAAGGRHTVAVKNDGTVWAWGNNDSGQLGDGTTVNRLAPVPVPGISGVSALAAGGRHTVAVKNDGTVWTWGLNEVGQLGDGTTSSRLTPVQVAGLTGMVAVVAGGGHTVALKNNGTAWAWGANYFGQLGDGLISTLARLLGVTGDGTTINGLAPVQVAGLTGVAALVAGVNHTIATRIDGTVWSWGANYSGQLGDGRFVPRFTYGGVINNTFNGFLDLDATIPNLPVPADRVPPLFFMANRSGALTSTSLSVDLRGLIASGAFASDNDFGRFAAGYNVYVAASVPTDEALVWYQLEPSNTFSALTSPIVAFLTNVALNSQTDQIRVNILQSMDLSQLLETSFYVGYGIDSDEMISSGRYSVIFTVQ